MIHYKKIWPEYFKAVKSGEKTFEIRENDEDYKVGDTLVLKEFIPCNDKFKRDTEYPPHYYDSYTGEEIIKEISYVFYGGNFGVDKNHCVLGLKPIGIELRNINLTGLTIVDELEKAEEEEEEFKQALITFLKDRHGISREHLLEELCDTIQAKLSTMKVIDIDIEEIVSYWNKVHNEKIKSRPRKENCL